MSAHTQCPMCNQVLRGPDRILGRRIICPKCRKTFLARPHPVAQKEAAAPGQPTDEATTDHDAARDQTVAAREASGGPAASKEESFRVVGPILGDAAEASGRPAAGNGAASASADEDEWSANKKPYALVSEESGAAPPIDLHLLPASPDGDSDSESLNGSPSSGWGQRRLRRRRNSELPRWPFWSGVWSFPFYETSLRAFFYLAGVGLILGILVRCLLKLVNVPDNEDVELALLLGQILPLVGIFLAGPLLLPSAAEIFFTVVECTAAGNEEVRWRREGFWDLGLFLKTCLLVFLVSIASALPAAVLLTTDAQLLAEPSGLLMCLASAWLLFPMLLFGCLTRGQIISLEFRRSLRRCLRSIVVFYLLSGPVLAAGVMAAFFSLVEESWLLLPFGAVVAAAAFLLYARLLGRLAWISAESFARPKPRDQRVKLPVSLPPPAPVAAPQNVADSGPTRAYVEPGAVEAPVEPAVEPAAPAAGRIGRFELRAELGQGGFGKVYRAYDPVLDREVALKVPKFGPDEKRKIQRFLAEAKAAARLRHPNIVAVFESGQAGDDFYIASEFVSGVPLSARLKQERPSFRQAAQWVRDLALALAYAHDEGIVHRDIKPPNIMIGHGQRPQLMDFGLAKRLGEDAGPQAAAATAQSGDANLTLDGTVLGTPAYMAPEQARGDIKAVGPHSDQYSLGVVLYELLTGRTPFQGQLRQILVDVTTTKPPAPRRLNRKIPRSLEAICLKAMAKEPAGRYATAADLAIDLQRWLTEEPIAARPLPTWGRAIRWSRQHPVAAGVIGLMATMVLLIAGLHLSSSATEISDLRAELKRVRADGAAALTDVQSQAATDLAKETAKWRRDHAAIHVDFGNALRDRQNLEEALAKYRKAIELDPKFPDPHWALGKALFDAGQYAEARASFVQYLNLTPPTPPSLREKAQDWLQRCTPLVELNQTLDFLVARDAISETELTDFCRRYSEYHAAVVRLCIRAFSTRPELAAWDRTHRYRAACAAVSAGAGQGLDPQKPRPEEQRKLRAQALDWLRADLAVFTQQARAGRQEDISVLIARLSQWEADAALTGVRQPEELAGLPGSEQGDWRKLWADVVRLRKSLEVVGPVYARAVRWWADVERFLLNAPQEETRSFSLEDGQRAVFNLPFQGGKKVEMWVKSNGKSDIDLYVFDVKGQEVRFDDGDSENCYLWFLTDAAQTYRVEVRNVHRIDELGRNGYNSGTLTFKESDGQGVAPPPPQKHQRKVVPLGRPSKLARPGRPGAPRPNPQMRPRTPRPNTRPKTPQAPRGVVNAKEIFRANDELDANDPLDRVQRQCRCKVFNVNLTAGVLYQIDMVQAGGSNIDPFLRLEDSDGKQLAADDDGGGFPNARITFRASSTGEYRIIATSFAPSVGGFTLTVKQQ